MQQDVRFWPLSVIHSPLERLTQHLSESQDWTHIPNSSLYSAEPPPPKGWSNTLRLLLVSHFPSMPDKCFNFSVTSTFFSSVNYPASMHTICWPFTPKKHALRKSQFQQSCHLKRQDHYSMASVLQALCFLHANGSEYSLDEAEEKNPEDPGMELIDHADVPELPGTKGISQGFPTRKHWEIMYKRVGDVSKENYSFCISPWT